MHNSSILSIVKPHFSSVRRYIRLQANRAKWSRVGVQIGQGVCLNEVELSPFVNIAHDADINRARIGKRTSIGRYTKINDAVIGSYCSISWDVTIGAISHPMDHLSSHAFWYRKQFGVVAKDCRLSHRQVRIGNDVWIGCDAIIMPGISVADGSVIGANSVVTKDVAPYTIVAGSPARQIGKRFDDDLAKRIENLEWWNWGDAELQKNMEYFSIPLTPEILKHIDACNSGSDTDASRNLAGH